MIQRAIAGRVKFLSTVGERQIKVIASDGSVDRMGDILVPWGCELNEYRRNPVILAQHDSAAPIARCSYIGVENSAVVATIDFPPPGTSSRSDEYLALLKAGVLGAVSVGFLPLEAEPIPRGGYKYLSWELLEISIVSVPANPAALVIERNYRAGEPVERRPSVLDFAGTLHQREQQAKFAYENSPAARAKRLRLLTLYQLQSRDLRPALERKM